MSHSTKEKSHVQSIQARFDHAPGRTMAPPTFQLRSDGPAPPLQLTGDPKIRKVHKDQLEYGKAETGPVAIKGRGDAHEFAASDVNQGMLGDCYFLAGLMSVAHTQPNLLKNAITDKGDGTYDVRLYKRTGMFNKKLEAQTVNVDSKFVVMKGTGTNAYARGGDRDLGGTYDQEIWVRLAEKAYAQMKGSYDKIEGGLESVALEALTGEKHKLENFNSSFLGIGKMSDADLISEIKGIVDAGDAISCGTTTQDAIDKADKKAGITFAKDNSIVGRHAYSILDADDTHVTVRNPHGQAVLTPEVKLTWAQFRTYFERFAKKK